MLALLSFLNTIWGRIIAALVACALAYGAGWLTGHRAAAGACRAVAVQAQLDAARADLAAHAAALADAHARAAALDLAAATATEKADAYARTLPAQSGCALDDHDARSLRAIGGAAAP